MCPVHFNMLFYGLVRTFSTLALFARSISCKVINFNNAHTENKENELINLLRYRLYEGGFIYVSVDVLIYWLLFNVN